LGTDFENEKLEEYLNRWNWRPIFECNERYNETLIHAFYANIVKTGDDEVPWGFHTYVCGKHIDCTLPKMAEYLGLVNDGEEVYLNNSWLPDRNAPSVSSYFTWFNVKDSSASRNLQRGRDPSFVASVLPSIHRLAFAFLNHIVTPKGGFKTNIEHHNLFFLRHLIDGSNRMFNIPFVIISHMRAAFTDSRRILPYPNLIMRILKANECPLVGVPLDIIPKNLWNDLKSHGWKRTHFHEATNSTTYENKGKLVDQWIQAPRAKPNQYTDPALGDVGDDGDSNDEGQASQPQMSNEFQNSVLASLANISLQNTQILKAQEEIRTNQTSIDSRLTSLETNYAKVETHYNDYYSWTRNEFKPMYDGFERLQERYFTRFGGDDEDLNNPGQSSGVGGDDDDDDGDDDPMVP
jgi:hypothetical protein